MIYDISIDYGDVNNLVGLMSIPIYRKKIPRQAKACHGIDV